MVWLRNFGAPDEHNRNVRLGQHLAPPCPRTAPPHAVRRRPDVGDAVAVRPAAVPVEATFHDVDARALTTAAEMQALPRNQRYKLLKLRLAAFQREQLDRQAVVPRQGERLRTRAATPVAWQLEMQHNADMVSDWD